MPNAQKALGDREALVRRRAIRGHLELGAARDAERLLGERARRRHEPVGHNRGNDEQLDLLWPPPRCLERAARRPLRHRRVGLAARRVVEVYREVARGNASLGEEIAHLDCDFDVVVAPIGGGGLTSGLITGLRRAGKSVPVIAAEPLIGNDAARSFRAGHIIANEREPQTLADGARTLSVGEHNWPILKDGLTDIIEVTEQQIREAVRLLFSFANLKSEPTGALAVGAVLGNAERFHGQKACCVISGGNVDSDLFRELLG